MADIITNTLQIGSNNLILQDAGARQNIATNTQDISDLKDGLQTVQTEVAATLITDTASGSIASFPDGADGVPVKSLTVDIEPVQDLHGQDNPYPAGGGKNKFHNTGATTTSNGVTFTVNADGTVSCSGTATGTAVFRVWLSYSDLPQGESLILNGCPDGGDFMSRYGTSLCSSNGAALGSKTDYGASATYTPAELADLAQYQIVVRSGINAGGLVFKPMIRLATETDATFSPYSNICPISGHTQAVVTRCGKNLLNVSASESGGIDGSGLPVEGSNLWRSTTLTPVYPSQSYVFNANRTFDNVRIYFYDENQNFLSRIETTNGTAFTTTASTRYIKWTLRVTDGTITTETVQNANMQIEKGSTASEYTAYNGQTYTIALGGTRYGGSLDVGTGVLTVDRAIVDLGTLTYTYDSASKRFGTQSNAIPIKPISGATVLSNMICSQYKTVKGQDQYDDITLDASISQGGGSSAIVRIRDTAYTDATAFKTAMNGVQLCYELATPFTVQLTAEDDITTLKGTNNIWNDCGNTEVEYRADTKLYIEKLTAPTEDDMIADHAISANTFFMVGNTLYRATTAIASGATITVGTNATRLSLADALNTLS